MNVAVKVHGDHTTSTKVSVGFLSRCTSLTAFSPHSEDVVGTLYWCDGVLKGQSRSDNVILIKVLVLVVGLILRRSFF